MKKSIKATPEQVKEMQKEVKEKALPLLDSFFKSEAFSNLSGNVKLRTMFSFAGTAINFHRSITKDKDASVEFLIDYARNELNVELVVEDKPDEADEAINQMLELLESVKGDRKPTDEEQDKLVEAEATIMIAEVKKVVERLLSLPSVLEQGVAYSIFSTMAKIIYSHDGLEKVENAFNKTKATFGNGATEPSVIRMDDINPKPEGYNQKTSEGKINEIQDKIVPLLGNILDCNEFTSLSTPLKNNGLLTMGFTLLNEFARVTGDSAHLLKEIERYALQELNIQLNRSAIENATTH